MVVDVNEQIETLIGYLKESDNIVFFGGAGVSTESGIPDFRSKDGLYNKKDIKFDAYDPEYLLSHGCLFNYPKIFFEFYKQKMDTRNIEPNITHKVLAKLEEIGKLKAIVTQNIDGLHQKAGNKNVYEIHGSALRTYCTNCKKKYDENFIFDNDEKIPTCPRCGGLVRPDIILYEETLPLKAVNNSVQAISNADMLIIGGTSLTVYPAASYINEFHGKHLIIVNKEKITLNNTFLGLNDMMIEYSLGDVFRVINDRLNEILGE